MGLFKEYKLKDLHWNRRTGMVLFSTDERLEQYINKLEIDIKKHGIKVPPKIRKLNASEMRQFKKPYRVLHGNHRCEVAKRLGFKKISCELTT